MGTITRTASEDQSTTAFQVSGDVEAEEVVKQIIAFLTDAPTPLVTWDVSGGSLHKLSPADLLMIIRRAGPYTGVRGGRTAIVCVNEVDYGLSRMFETFAKVYEIPFEIRVFRDPEKAQSWLNELP